MLAGGCGLLQTQKEGSQCRPFLRHAWLWNTVPPFTFWRWPLLTAGLGSESARETSADGRRVVAAGASAHSLSCLDRSVDRRPPAARRVLIKSSSFATGLRSPSRVRPTP